ncbi:MAG: DUF5050 domain-containing protein [Ignavibacteriales bacterium]
MKYIKSTILVLIIIAVAFCAGCFKRDQKLQQTQAANADKDKVNAVNTVGNTQGNILNRGLIASQGEWIYYSDKGIYKERLDGKSRTKLCDDEAWYLNVVGEWIYFANISDAYSLYKVKIDGTEKTKMNSEIVSDLNVVGEWIYYIETQRVQTTNGLDDYTNLWKIKTDGTNKIKIYDNFKTRTGYVIGTISNLYAVKDALYFNLHQYEGEDNGIYRMDVNGTKMSLVNGECCIYTNYGNNWIYYRQFSNYDIYRMKYDGSERVQLNKTKDVDINSNFSMNVSGDWIYFCQNGLYKIKTNGEGKVKISDDNCEQINVLGDWIYFTDKQSSDRLYKIKTDGSVRTRVDVSSIYEEFTEQNIKLKLEKVLPAGFEFLKFTSSDIDKDGYPEVAAAFEKVTKEGKTQTQISVFKWNNRLGKFQENYSKILDSVSNGVKDIKSADIIKIGVKNFVFIYDYDSKNSGILILGYENKAFKQIYNFSFKGGLDIDDSDKDGLSEIVGINRFVQHVQKTVMYNYYKWNGQSFAAFNRKYGYKNEDETEGSFVYPVKPEQVVQNFIQSSLIDFKDELEKFSVNDKVISYNLKNNFWINSDGGLTYFAAKVTANQGQTIDIKAFGKKEDKVGVTFRLLKKDGVWKVSQVQ